MRHSVFGYSFFGAIALSANLAFALPELDLVKSISIDGKQIQYMPDSADPNAFYFVPDSLEISKDSAGNLRFGFQHWGITKKDNEGVGGNFTFTVRPSWDTELVEKATIELRNKLGNQNASLAVVPIEKSYFDVAMTNNFASDATYITPPTLLDDYTIKYSTTLKDLGITPKALAGQDEPTNVLESVSGAGGNSTQAFTIPLTSLGGRLSNATPNEKGGEAGFLVVRYRFMVKGVTPKFRAELRVHWKKAYEHFHAQFGGGYWFWRSSHVVDIQSMSQDGSIELKIVSGAVDDKNETLIDSVFQSLVNARINGTGMFAPQLKPGSVGGEQSGGGSFFGWSVNSNSSFQKLSESVEQLFIIDKQSIQHRAFAIGAAFGPLCTTHKDQFVNLSEGSKPCPNDDDIDKLIKRSETCVDDFKSKLVEAKAVGADYYQIVFAKMKKACGV
jgi:hypothetical protein